MPTSNNYYWPPQNTIHHNEIPIWMTFWAKDWSTFNARRTRDAVVSGADFSVTLPFPKQLITLNSQNYVAGNALNVQAVETKDMFATLKQEIIATRELFNSFISGGSVVRADHFETILEPGARRTHVFEWNLVARNQEEAEKLNFIPIIFQNNTFPIANTSSLLTMRHPYIWYFEAVKGNLGNIDEFYPIYWDGEPLVCVLKSVDINRSPILNTPFVTPNYTPIAVNLKLTFIELEPAMQKGDGSTVLLSRAERYTDADGRTARKQPSRWKN